jgi:hypothetical protein
VRPAVVIIETHIEFGAQNVVVPYHPDYQYLPKIHPEYFGASAPAMLSLAAVRKDIFPDRVPSVSLESVLCHPRHMERLKLFEPIRNFAYVAL